MHVIAGAILFIIILYISSAAFGEWGVIAVSSLAFGMLYSTLQRLKSIRDDLLLIKGKLNIPIDANEKERLNKLEIESSLKAADDTEPASIQIRNQQIEAELEKEQNDVDDESAHSKKSE